MRIFPLNGGRRSSFAAGGQAGYDVAARIAGLRAHTGFGALLTANHADFPEANGGLALPEGPTTTTTTETASLSTAQTLMNSTGQDVILTPGSYTGGITISTGTHNKLTLTGCTLTGEILVTGGTNSHHLLIDGGTCRNFRAYNFSTRSDFVSHVHFKNITATFSTDTTDLVWRVRNCLVERCSQDHTAGGNAFIMDPFSMNVLIMNSRFRTGKPANNEFENAVRGHGCHLFFCIDSSMETYLNGATNVDLKYCWRSHNAGALGALPQTKGGTNGLINVQLEYGGTFTGNAGGSVSEINNTQLVFADVNQYTPSSTSDTGVTWQISNNSPFELNTNAYCLRVHKHDDREVAESSITTIIPPGTRIDTVNKDYVSTPAWSFYTTTPITAAE